MVNQTETNNTDEVNIQGVSHVTVETIILVQPTSIVVDLVA